MLIDSGVWKTVTKTKQNKNDHFTAVQENYGNKVKHFSCNIHEQYKDKGILQAKLS